MAEQRRFGAPRSVASSVAELLDGAERREPFAPPVERSRSRFERVWIEGRPHILKHLHVDDDLMLRALGDTGARTVRAYAAGLFDAAPQAVDHAVVGMAIGDGRNGWGCAVLMRDASDDLVSPDAPLEASQHEAFVDHLAQLCAATWGWRDDLGLAPYAARWAFTTEVVLACERAFGDPEGMAALATAGWEVFAEQAPADLGRSVDELRRDVAPLAAALAATPSCFLHGDWKASNLGTARDGRTVLLDWVYLGEGPACHDLCWYLAMGRGTLPCSNDEAAGQLRAALERHGVSTEGWWERQLALAALGTIVQVGWGVYLEDVPQRDWWLSMAREGVRLL